MRVLKAIQSVCDAPLQIDSTKPDVLEAGLRAYNGRPIVNSVNGEEKALARFYRLLKNTVLALSVLHLTKTVFQRQRRADLKLQKEL